MPSISSHVLVMVDNLIIISIKESLRRRFADAANEFALILNTVALEISDMKGDIEECYSLSLRLVTSDG